MGKYSLDITLKDKPFINIEVEDDRIEYKIIKVSRKAYIIEYVDYHHPYWQIKEHKFKSRLKAEKHIKKHFLVEVKQ